MATPIVLTQTELRALARLAIHTGRVPECAPTHIWGRAAQNVPCAVCADPITPDQREMTVQCSSPTNGAISSEFHVHERCLGVWTSERDKE